MSRSPVQEKIREDVARQGWSWIWVFDPEGDSPPFAYTIGLKATFDHPEMVVVGLPQGSSEGVLKAVHAEISNGTTFGDGYVSDDILEAFVVRFKELPAGTVSDNLAQAVEFYGDRYFGALQLYWPDRDGNFPGDTDAPAWLNERQLLGS